GPPTTPARQTGPVGPSIPPLQLMATSSGGYLIPSFSATGLPPGLSLTPSTGQISGTPTTAGSYAVTASATDSHGVSSTSQGFTWTINQASSDSVTLTNPGTQPGTVGTSASLQLLATSRQANA